MIFSGVAVTLHSEIIAWRRMIYNQGSELVRFRTLPDPKKEIS